MSIHPNGYRRQPPASEPPGIAPTDLGRPGQLAGAFTSLELLVVLLVLACSAAVLVPALAKTRHSGKSFQCLANHRQLTMTWQMYAADNGERVANNFGINQTEEGINNGTLDNWANNVMTWGATVSVSDRSNTNRDWFYRGALGKYLDAPIEAYKCPADVYLSAMQVAAGWKSRLRSVSMNSVLGRFSDGNDVTAQEINWTLSQYAQYLKLSRVPKPFKTWVFVDEHPDSINDGYFVNNPTGTSWQDIPAAYHNGGCTFSFADGHAEVRSWTSYTSQYAVRYSYSTARVFDASGRADFAWYLERTGYRNRSTGEMLFGY